MTRRDLLMALGAVVMPKPVRPKGDESACVRVHIRLDGRAIADAVLRQIKLAGL